MKVRVRYLALVIALVLVAWMVPPASPFSGPDSRTDSEQDDRRGDATVVAVEISDVASSGTGAGPIRECSVTYRSTRPRGPADPGSESPARTTVLRISIRHESVR